MSRIFLSAARSALSTDSASPSIIDWLTCIVIHSDWNWC